MSQRTRSSVIDKHLASNNRHTQQMCTNPEKPPFIVGDDFYFVDISE